MNFVDTDNARVIAAPVIEPAVAASGVPIESNVVAGKKANRFLVSFGLTILIFPFALFGMVSLSSWTADQFLMSDMHTMSVDGKLTVKPDGMTSPDASIATMEPTR